MEQTANEMNVKDKEKHPLRHSSPPLFRTALLVAITLLASTLQRSAAQTPEAPPNPPPDDRFKTDVLLIVAHPDDETAIGSYLAKLAFDQRMRVAIIYANRGEGGGNSIGNEQSTSLGAVREIEARRAVAAFGIHNVWFLNGRDTPGQDVFRSLQAWGHGATLEQVVRLVRLTRPEVILTWLPNFVAGENHGDHQAAGVVATEAFDLAGDPTAFPAQVTTPRERTDINNATEGLRPWQPKKMYYFSDASHPIEAAGPPFDLAEVSPSKKDPYYKLAAELHTYHRTQGEVAQVASDALKSGDFSLFQKWLGRFKLIFGKSVILCKSAGEVLEGITPAAAPFKRVRGHQEERRTGVSLELGGAFAFYRDFWRAHEIEHLASLVEPEIEIAVSSYLHIPIIIRNATPDSVVVSLTSERPQDWKDASGMARYCLTPYENRTVETFFIAPAMPDEQMREILVKGTTTRGPVGTVRMRVKVSEWTLPQ